MIRGKFIQRYDGAEFTPKITSVITLREAHEKLDQRADSKYGYIGGDPRDYRRDQNLFAENTGNANLRIKIFDPSAGVVLPMVSRNIKVDVTTAVADYFDKRGIRYDLR